MDIPRHFLEGITYRFSVAEVERAAVNTRGAFLKKIEERRGRIAKIRADNKITDAALNELLQQAINNRGALMYTVSVANSARANSMVDDDIDSPAESVLRIPAGVVSALMAEQQEMKKEQDAVDRLNVIIRNSAHIEEPVKLNFDDVDFLNLGR